MGKTVDNQGYIIDHEGFDPLPPAPRTTGQDWGEEELISYAILGGFCFFVQFHPRFASGKAVVDRRNQAIDWLKEQGIPYNWVGGRANYELVFRTAEDATMFKLAFG